MFFEWIAEAHLFKNDCELLLVRISWQFYDLLKRDEHMLKNNVKAIVSHKSFKNSDDILMLKLSKYMQRLCKCFSWECSYMNKLNEKGLQIATFMKSLSSML